MQLILETEAPNVLLREKMESLDQQTLTLTEKPIPNGDIKDGDVNGEIDNTLVNNSGDNGSLEVVHGNGTSEKNSIVENQIVTNNVQDISPENESTVEKAIPNEEITETAPSSEVIEEAENTELKEIVSNAEAIVETTSSQDLKKVEPVSEDSKVEELKEAITVTENEEMTVDIKETASTSEETNQSIPQIKPDSPSIPESNPVIEEILTTSLTAAEESPIVEEKVKEAVLADAEPKQTNIPDEVATPGQEILETTALAEGKEVLPTEDLMETDLNVEEPKTDDTGKETQDNLPSQNNAENSAAPITEDMVPESNVLNDVELDKASQELEMDVDEEDKIEPVLEKLITEHTETTHAMEVDNNAINTSDVLENEVNESISALVNNITKDLEDDLNNEDLDEFKLESETKEEPLTKELPVVSLNENAESTVNKDINEPKEKSETKLPKENKDEISKLEPASDNLDLGTDKIEESMDCDETIEEPKIAITECLEESQSAAVIDIENNQIEAKSNEKESTTDDKEVPEVKPDEDAKKLDVSMEANSEILKSIDHTDGDVITIKSSGSESLSVEIVEVAAESGCKTDAAVASDDKTKAPIEAVGAIVDLDDDKIVEVAKSDSEPQIKWPEKELKITPFIKLSNTMDILSDDEDEPPKKTENDLKTDIQETQENRCINLDDDDDIMLIDDDTSKEKITEDTQENIENNPEIEAKPDKIVDLDFGEKKESETKNEDKIVDLDSDEKIESEQINNDKIVDLDSEEKPDRKLDNDVKIEDLDSKTCIKPQIVDLDIEEKSETKLSPKDEFTDLETIKPEDSVKSPGTNDLDKESQQVKNELNNVDVPVKDVIETSAKLEEPKPLIPKDFFKTYRKNLTDMTRDDLEEFCILKIVESIIDRSNLHEIRAKLKSMAQNIDEYKKKAMMLTKQNRDLQVVLKSVQEEQKKRNNQPIAPLKITRSVGMQVLMTDRNRKRNMPIPTPSAANPSANQVPSNNNTRVTRTSSLTSKGSKAVAPQQIPVPRLVPAGNNQQNKPNASTQVSNNVAKNVNNSLNGVKIPSAAPKASEKRTHSRMQAQQSASPSPSSSSVTVDLTDDEPPSKVPAKSSPVPPVRLVYQPNLLSPRQPFQQSTSSPRKVFIPINGQGQVRGNQTIMLKTVASSGAPKQKAGAFNSPPMVRLPSGSNAVTAVRRFQGNNRHPAPLPDIMKQYQPPNWKALPPAPDLKLSKVENGIVISWKIDGYQEDSYEEIASYQLYAYQETSAPPSTALWKKIGDVKALPLPMACTLTQFMAGYKYYFAVRAVDIKSRLGPFSLPGSILLLNKM